MNKKLNLPELEYYTLEEASDVLGCTVKNLIHWGALGKIKICFRAFLDEIWDGEDSEREYKLLYFLVDLESDNFFFKKCKEVMKRKANENDGDIYFITKSKKGERFAFVLKEEKICIRL